jgi:hypothetical protein
LRTYFDEGRSLVEILPFAFTIWLPGNLKHGTKRWNLLGVYCKINWF